MSKIFLYVEIFHMSKFFTCRNFFNQEGFFISRELVRMYNFSILKKDQHQGISQPGDTSTGGHFHRFIRMEQHFHHLTFAPESATTWKCCQNILLSRSLAAFGSQLGHLSKLLSPAGQRLGRPRRSARSAPQHSVGTIGRLCRRALGLSVACVLC